MSDINACKWEDVTDSLLFTRIGEADCPPKSRVVACAVGGTCMVYLKLKPAGSGLMRMGRSDLSDASLRKHGKSCAPRCV